MIRDRKATVERKMPVQQRARRTRKLILITAEALIEEKGQYASTGELAARVPCSIGTIYTYFDDMPTIMAELGYRLTREKRDER
jgi:AcrR family transcriptional regulator